MAQPVVPQPSLAEVLATLEPIEEGFPPIDDPPVRPEQALPWPICPAVSASGRQRRRPEANRS